MQLTSVATYNHFSASPVVRVELRTETMLVQRGAFLGGQLVEERVPVVSLSFGYNGSWHQGDPLGAAARNRSEENAARRVLEGFGAVEMSYVEHYEPAFDSQAEYAICVDGDSHAFCAFSAYVLPQLRQLGWQVEVASDYPYRVLEGELPWYIEADPETSTGGDWFELELGIVSRGKRIRLLPALLRLIETSPEQTSFRQALQSAGRCVALPVGDGTYVPVPTKQMERLLSILTELYEGQRCAFEEPKSSKRGPTRRKGKARPPSKLRFRALDAPSLARLDEVFAPGPVVWDAPADLRSMGRALLSAERQQTAVASLRATLRSYQVEGMSWLQHLRRLGVGAILADDMGLGKTLQTIAHILVEKENNRLFDPILVVAPTSLVTNWVREIKKFAPKLKPFAWHGPKRHRSANKLFEADVIVTSYPLLWRDMDRMKDRRFHMVILDEAQAIKNASSRASRAVRQLEAGQRICLSGTPLENNLGELHSLFDFMVPGLLGSRDAFRTRYRQPIEQGDNDRLEELRRRVSPFILRRLKSEVATELPPKTEMVRPISLADSQRELYESIRIAAHADVRKAIRAKGLAGATLPVLDALMKLRQVCCDPRLVRVPAAQLVKRSGKLEALLEMVPRLLAAGRKILIFSQFARMLSLISEELLAAGLGHVTLTGATRDRQAKIDAFQQGRADIFLISLKAGGTGLTLTRADTVIHYDPWWNPAAQAQATDRAYRIGQQNPVFVYQLIAAGSVEEKMLKLQRRKQQLADAILSTGSAALRLDDVDDLFAPIESL